MASSPQASYPQATGETGLTEAELDVLAREQTLAEQRRRERGRLATVLALPPVMGTIIIVLVLTGHVSERVLKSGEAISFALLVGALLILVPPALFALQPDRYAEHQTTIADAFEGLWKKADQDGSPKPGDQPALPGRTNSQSG
jgi:hypothetical protein